MIRIIKSDFLKNTLLLLIVLSLIYVTGEVFLRFYFDRQLGYRSDNIAYSINSEELRDYEHSLDKPNQTIRILVLGDSFTFGQGVKEFDKIYPSLLEKMLNNKTQATRYEVINFGVPGSNEFMKIDILKQKGLKYRPDIVIFQHRLWYGDINLMKKYIPTIEIEAKARELNLYFFVWINSKIRKINSKIMGFVFQEKNNKKKGYSVDMYGSDSDDVLFLKEVFKELGNISRERNLTVVCLNLVWFDTKDWETTYNSQKDSYDFIKSVCEENNFYFLDPYDFYRPYTVKELRISFLDPHPNEKGHKVISEAVYAFLIKEKLITDLGSKS